MAKPKFKVGQLVNEITDKSAKFVVTTVSVDHAGEGVHRYYGNGVGRYESDLELSDDANVALYHIERSKQPQINGTVSLRRLPHTNLR